MKTVILTIAISLGITVAAQAQRTQGQTLNPDPTSIVRPTNVNSPVESLYQELLCAHRSINEKIEMLTSQSSMVTGGKQKKLQKELNELNTQREIIERHIEALPESLKNPSLLDAQHIQIDTEFREQLQQRAAARAAQNNPFKGKLSNDPELDALYRSQVGTVDTFSYDASDVVYRVLFSIAARASNTISRALSDVYEQRMPNGTVAYYQGNYSTFQQAQNACSRILAQGKFRDAFVVAMVGDRRIPLNK